MAKKNYPPMTLGQEFKFGKHKGESVENVIDRDISYIAYMMEQKYIELDNEAYEYYIRFNT